MCGVPTLDLFSFTDGAFYRDHAIVLSVPTIGGQSTFRSPDQLDPRIRLTRRTPNSVPATTDRPMRCNDSASSQVLVCTEFERTGRAWERFGSRCSPKQTQASDNGLV